MFGDLHPVVLAETQAAQASGHLPLDLELRAVSGTSEGLEYSSPDQPPPIVREIGEPPQGAQSEALGVNIVAISQRHQGSSSALPSDLVQIIFIAAQVRDAEGRILPNVGLRTLTPLDDGLKHAFVHHHAMVALVGGQSRQAHQTVSLAVRVA